MIEYLPSVSMIVDELGDKMQTTGIHLWKILVNQQFSVGITYSIVSLIFIVFMSGIVTFIIKTHNKYKQTVGPSSEEDVSLLFLYCIGLVLLFLIILFSHDAFTCFMNPEYMAIQSILSKL